MSKNDPKEAPDIETRFARGPQIISEKGILQIEESFNFFKGKNLDLLIYNTSVSYGVLHQLGVRAEIPAVLHFREKNTALRAFGDIYLLVDWHFFRRNNYLMTMTSGLKLPTASKQTFIVTANQSLAWPIELQTFFKTENWYAESDYFSLITIAGRKKVKFGNFYSFSYALGPHYQLSHRKFSKLLLLGRITGYHSRPTEINHLIDKNSGGTLILIGPDIILSDSFIVLRGLFQVSIVDRSFGIQAITHFRSFFSAKFLF